MSRDTIRLDPEVRELLLDISRDPHSTLFRTVPREVVTSATMDLPSVSAGTAGWTPAERHLLRGYREELAEALAAVYRDLSADRGAAAHFTTAPRRERSAQDLELLGLSACFADLESGLRETVATLAAGSGAQVPLDRITGVICRLRSDHRSANLHGMALVLEGKLQEAGRLLRTVLEESLRPSIRYYAAINLGMAIALSDAPLEATLEPTYIAIRCRPSLPGLASLMVNGSLIGKHDAARVAMEFFDDVVPDAPHVMAEMIEMYEARSWSQQDQQALRGLRQHAGRDSGRLIDAALA